MSKFIMLTKVHTTVRFSLWKGTVENPVDNVENYVFSTAIFHFAPAAACIFVCISGCITLAFSRGASCYVAVFLRVASFGFDQKS